MSELQKINNLIASGMFDPEFYLKEYPDVRQSGMDPFLHYVRYGEKEKRKLNAWQGKQPMGVNLPCISNQPHNGKKIIPVVFCVDEKFLPYLSVAVCSLLKNKSEQHFYKIFILHDNIAEENQSRILSQQGGNLGIKFINVHEQAETLLRDVWISNHITTQSYYRLLIPLIFKNFPKIIYLDSDLLVLHDIAELFNFSIDGFLLGGVRCFFPDEKFHKDLIKSLPEIDPESYINAGVLLFNNKNIFVSNALPAIVDLIKSGRKFVCHDQDILNIACKNKIRLLPGVWNFQWSYYFQEHYRFMEQNDVRELLESMGQTKIAHYTSGKKPWVEDDGYFSGMFWDYAKMSPYYEDLKKQKK